MSTTGGMAAELDRVAEALCNCARSGIHEQRAVRARLVAPPRGRQGSLARGQAKKLRELQALLAR